MGIRNMRYHIRGTGGGQEASDITEDEKHVISLGRREGEKFDTGKKHADITQTGKVFKFFKNTTHFQQRQRIIAVK